MIGIIASLAFAAQDPEIDCSDAQTQMAMNVCSYRSFEEADAALNEFWDGLGEQRVEALEAQRSWLKFRDEQCHAEAARYEGGSIQPMMHSGCMTRMTTDRLRELREQFSTDHDPAGIIQLGLQHFGYSLEEVREINVVLPLSYDANPERRYPTVYFLDGGIAQDFMMQVGVSRWTQMWGRTGEFIIVGIETKDRQRELLPPTTDEEALEVWPTAGESAVFREWIRTDVMPLIEANYRTDGRDFLVGESAAGHFVIETLLTEPFSFDGYAAISPSLWWEKMAMAKMAETISAPKHPPLFISIANEGETMDEGVRAVVNYRPPLSETCFADRPDLTHGNSYHALLPGALQFLLPGEEPLPEEWGMVTGCAE